MRLLIVLSFLFLAIVYRIVSGDSSFFKERELRQVLSKQQEVNEKLSQKNLFIKEIIQSFKINQDYIEEYTRSSLGLIAPNETFFLLPNS